MIDKKLAALFVAAQEQVLTAAQILQRRNAGRRGGPARAEKLTPERRSEIARQASIARWAAAMARKARDR